MSWRRDPVQRRRDDSTEDRSVAEWTPDSTVDRAIYRLYPIVRASSLALAILATAVILASQFAVGSLDALADPMVGAFVVISALPALVLVAYVRYADVTASAPVGLLAATVGLGIAAAGVASVLNGVLVGPAVSSLLAVDLAVTVAAALSFLLIVAPLEEGLKLLALWLYPYRRPAFDAVVAGAVYGAAIGLGFAAVENAIYISRAAATASPGAALLEGGTVTTQRALAGPGHVIYSAFAGYYLGLAKFNREYAGPIVLKGLSIAVLLHGLHNVLVLVAPEHLSALLGFSEFAAIATFVIAYDGILILVLVRKLSVYRAAYDQTRVAGNEIPSERTEFE